MLAFHKYLVYIVLAFRKYELKTIEKNSNRRHINENLRLSNI